MLVPMSRRLRITHGEPPEADLVARRVGDLRRALGLGFDHVALDLREGLDADALAAAQGFVRRGGELTVVAPQRRPEALAVWPHAREEVGDRLWRRVVETVPLSPSPAAGPSQAAVVDALRGAWAGPRSLDVLLARRGRGKSAALGLAALDQPGVVLTAPRRQAASEVLRFAPDLAFTPLDEALCGTGARVLLIDEAAQLSVPVLQALVERHPDAHLAFATTTEGYEGTGRGFVLRFLRWLEAHGEVRRHRLTRPMRWDPGDLLEARLDRALCLDAWPAPAEAVADATAAACTHRVEDRDQLAADGARLRELFGLLAHAHYRTTPADLHRLLDAPNLAVHTLSFRDHVVATCVVAREGGLPDHTARQMVRGRLRIRGHALADTLVTHAVRPDAAGLRMVRSVRIATHPSLHRRGLASALVEAVHATWQPDLFGTLFGATPEVVRFRERLGYRLVRVGSARGERTGEPSVVMVRPCSEAAEALVRELRGELGHNLPLQRQLQAAEHPGIPAPAFEQPEPGAWGPERVEQVVRAYLDGAVHHEAVAWALRAHVEGRDLSALSPADADLVRKRVLELRSWREAAGPRTVRHAQKALRAAIGRL